MSELVYQEIMLLAVLATCNEASFVFGSEYETPFLGHSLHSRSRTIFRPWTEKKRKPLHVRPCHFSKLFHNNYYCWAPIFFWVGGGGLWEETRRQILRNLVVQIPNFSTAYCKIFLQWEIKICWLENVFRTWELEKKKKPDV